MHDKCRMILLFLCVMAVGSPIWKPTPKLRRVPTSVAWTRLSCVDVMAKAASVSSARGFMSEIPVRLRADLKASVGNLVSCFPPYMVAVAKIVRARPCLLGTVPWVPQSPHASTAVFEPLQRTSDFKQLQSKRASRIGSFDHNELPSPSL